MSCNPGYDGFLCTTCAPNYWLALDDRRLKCVACGARFAILSRFMCVVLLYSVLSLGFAWLNAKSRHSPFYLLVAKLCLLYISGALLYLPKTLDFDLGYTSIFRPLDFWMPVSQLMCLTNQNSQLIYLLTPGLAATVNSLFAGLAIIVTESRNRAKTRAKRKLIRALNHKKMHQEVALLKHQSNQSFVATFPVSDARALSIWRYSTYDRPTVKQLLRRFLEDTAICYLLLGFMSYIPVLSICISLAACSNVSTKPSGDHMPIISLYCDVNHDSAYSINRMLASLLSTVWGIGVPLSCLIITVTQKAYLFKSESERSYSLLHSGYKGQYRYFEQLIFLYKGLLVVLYTFSNTAFDGIRRASLLSFVLLTLLASVNPFITYRFRVFNRLTASCVGTLATESVTRPRSLPFVVLVWSINALYISCKRDAKEDNSDVLRIGLNLQNLSIKFGKPDRSGVPQSKCHMGPKYAPNKRQQSFTNLITSALSDFAQKCDSACLTGSIPLFILQVLVYQRDLLHAYTTTTNSGDVGERVARLEDLRTKVMSNLQDRKIMIKEELNSKFDDLEETEDDLILYGKTVLPHVVQLLPLRSDSELLLPFSYAAHHRVGESDMVKDLYVKFKCIQNARDEERQTRRYKRVEELHSLNQAALTALSEEGGAAPNKGGSLTYRLRLRDMVLQLNALTDLCLYTRDEFASRLIATEDAGLNPLIDKLR